MDLHQIHITIHPQKSQPRRLETYNRLNSNQPRPPSVRGDRFIDKVVVKRGNMAEKTPDQMKRDRFTKLS